jgi:C-terminal processing protease CtpA/Prc
MRIASSLTLPLILILSACSSQPTPKEKNPSVAQQQSSADKAYDELDAEINEIERVVVEPKRKIVKRPVATKSEPTTSKRKIVSRNRTVTTKTTQTKYPLQNGLPVWFFQPDMDGKFGGIGIAKPQKRGGLAAQRRVAINIAKADLAKRMKIAIDASIKTEKHVKNNTFTSKLTSLSRQEASQFLENTSVEDIWISENRELYIWLVINK